MDGMGVQMHVSKNDEKAKILRTQKNKGLLVTFFPLASGDRQVASGTFLGDFGD